MENATEKFREGRPNFREDIKLFIGLPKQPLLELSPPVSYILIGNRVRVKSSGMAGGWQMPGPRAVQNLQMPHPRD